MKSRSMRGAAAGVALVTVAAMSATAMPQIFSDSDSFFAGSSTSEALTEVPDLPDEETIAAAKGDPDAQAKLREDLKEILEKSNQRLAEAEGRTLSSNEKVRELSEAAAEARREAETAAQQAELASEENERDQENAGEAVADMYRNGGLSTEEFMLGDEDALSANALNQQINDGLASDADDSEANSNAHSHLSDNQDAKSDALADAQREAEEREAEEERERQRLAEEEAERQAEQERQEQQRIAVATTIQESEEVDEDEATDIVEELEDESTQEAFDEVAGTATASSESSPTSTEAASEAPVTPTEEAPEEEPESSAPAQEPEQESTPTQESTPEPAQTTAPEPTQTATPEPASTPTSTPTQTQTPTQTPTQTQTPTPTPTRTATPTPTQTETTAAPEPEPEPTQTTPAAPPSGNMSAAVNWAVNKTNEPGTSYVWGGNGPKGYDCSGFTVAAFAQAGKSLPRVSSAQYAAAKQYVSLDNLQPGDLVFWSNNGQGSGVYHVAIYIGNGQIAHARNPSTGITITDLHYSPWGMLSVGGRY